MIDTHSHLTDERFEGEVPEVMARARAAGLAAVVTLGTELADSERVVNGTAQILPGPHFA